MAVTEVKETWRGASVKASTGGVLEYTSEYYVTTNNGRDNGRVILDYFQASLTLPWPGRTYAYADESDPAAICTDLDPQRQSDTRWLVRVTHKTKQPDTMEDGEVDEQGQLVQDPLLFRPRVSVSTTKYQRDVWKAKLISGIKVGGVEQGEKANVAVTNSALVPFDPPPQRDDSRSLLTVQRNVSAFDGRLAEEWYDTVNDLPFEVIAWPLYQQGSDGIIRLVRAGFVFGALKRAAKIDSITASEQETNGISFYEVTISIDIDNQFTWVDEILDRGLHARRLAGDPDGRGGTVSSGDIVSGAAQHERIRDYAGDGFVQEPVLLDGEGQPLDPPDGTHKFIKYLYYPEKTFSDCPYLQGVISGTNTPNWITVAGF